MHGSVKPPCLDTISFLQHKFAGAGCRACLGFSNTDPQDGFHALCALSARFMCVLFILWLPLWREPISLDFSRTVVQVGP